MKKMSKGKYWIGDLCYVMEKEWKEVCRLMYKDKYGIHKLSNGIEFAILCTAYGDGKYKHNVSSVDKLIGVDSGTIGCIKIKDISSNKKYNLDLGIIVDFKNDFHVKDEDGTLKFGDVEVYTDDNENDDNE